MKTLDKYVLMSGSTWINQYVTEREARAAIPAGVPYTVQFWRFPVLKDGTHGKPSKSIVTEHGLYIPLDDEGRPLRDQPERYTQVRAVGL